MVSWDPATTSSWRARVAHANRQRRSGVVLMECQSCPVRTRAYPAKARPIAASANTTITNRSRHRLDRAFIDAFCPDSMAVVTAGWRKERVSVSSRQDLSSLGHFRRCGNSASVAMISRQHACAAGRQRQRQGHGRKPEGEAVGAEEGEEEPAAAERAESAGRHLRIRERAGHRAAKAEEAERVGRCVTA